MRNYRIDNIMHVLNADFIFCPIIRLLNLLIVEVVLFIF